MKTQDYTATIAVNATPHEVFNSINSVSKWWTDDLEGSSKKLNDEFIPGKKVVWLVTDSNLNFINDKQEWTNTKISFELSSQDSQTIIHFTHFGLAPTVECYSSCSKGWDHFIKGSLFKLLTEGKGTPGLF